ncbi:hypothetical protein ACFQPA_10835 [Halomarina halobia]|uniref:Uncharacterized protein n=1 Tax=Halomarina halobia TaxID=3033386 RepID=A0ABD6AB74_9EURY|nr:hypothetical protein [Halomarina sp. PSR21]
MPDIGEETEYADRLASNADQLKDAWEATLEEMRAIAAELEAEGWDVTAVSAVNTAPTNPEAGESDRFGLVHVVADNRAEDFRGAFERGTGASPESEDGEVTELGGFERYEVFRTEAGGSAFQVTVLYADEPRVAIVLAGGYELAFAQGMIRTAIERDEMYTHVQTLDKTHLGSFRHEDWELFFPEARQRFGIGEDDEE